MGHTVTLTEPVTFEREDCASCAVVFFVPSDLQRRARADKRSFYCPNGHSMSYTQSEAARLRKKLEEANAALVSETKRKEWAETATRQQMQRADKAEKETRRLKRRVSAGVCTCCNRTFQNVARHMQTKHKDAHS